MTPENFIYWLQGFLEIGNPTEITDIQIQEIKNHISLVLKKETPNIGYYLGNPYQLNDLQVVNFGPCASC